MKFSGPLTKMKSQYNTPVQYLLDIGSNIIVMNDLIGKTIKIEHTGKVKCFCGEIKDKLYRNGFCYDCFYSRPEAGDSIFRPELSKAHLGIEDRDLEWEKRNQLQPHVVYLANSAGLKVGVTRKAQVPTRWIDQGASEAVTFVEVENRYLAGVVEVAMKDHVADKTPWQRMVKNEVPEVDLLVEKKRLSAFIPEEVVARPNFDLETMTITYPVESYPLKAKSLNLDKTNELEAKLMGIKGQYLLFENGIVFNVRSHEGYIVNLYVS